MGILQQAASEVFSESEQNFDVIRNKHWYKRLFELLTFSRNNEKVLAKNVASISKIQEIIVKTLLLLSVQNTDLSGDIRNLTEGHRLLSEQVYRLSNTQYKLANYIIELKYGGKKELLISNLIDHKKSVIIGVYTSFVYENKKLASKTSKDFTAALYKAFGTNTPEKRDDSDSDERAVAAADADDGQHAAGELLQHSGAWRLHDHGVGGAGFRHRPRDGVSRLRALHHRSAAGGHLLLNRRSADTAWMNRKEPRMDTTEH